MRAGELRKRITIKAPASTNATDSFGEQTPSYAATRDWWECWAAIEPLSGQEKWEAQQSQPRVTHRIRIRYREGITSRHRIAFGARTFEITSALDIDERHSEMHLLCVEET